MKASIRRQRLTYLVLTAISIMLGLLSRAEWVRLPHFIATYAGDTIWALMVFFLFCTIAPRRTTLHLATAALLFAFGIEFLQFYRSPWIEAIRDTTLGGLILGFGFKASDLLCYAVGIAIGAAIDRTAVHQTPPTNHLKQDPD